MEWTQLLDRNGAVLHYVEGTRDGLPLADLARVPEGRSVGDAVAVLLQRNAGYLLATEDRPLAEGVLAAGGRQIRHAFVMSAETAGHREAAVIETVPRSSVDVRAFLHGWLTAYPPGHPDHEEGTDDEIIARCWDEYDERDWIAREHRSTGLVLEDGQIAAGIIVGIRPQPVPFGGPWVRDVWRVPEVSQPGTGAALLAQSMRMLDEDGLPTLGLTVSAGNPARRVYERLGFVQQLESWTVLIPD
ncbi:MAG: GNAT family N-acetyltransferase [Actinomycetes bacterium]